jgi:signal transduction histidine kinase
MTGDALLDRVHDQDRERTLLAWSQWTDAMGLDSFENRIRTRDGALHRIHWHVYPVRDDRGDLRDIQAIGRDFTWWDVLEEKVRAGQRTASVARLVQGLAHKFNNMLVSVLGNASVLASQLDKDHPWRTIVDDIAAGAERAGKLTRQLMTYARSTPQVLQRHRLRDLLTDYAELGQSAVPAGVSLEVHAEAENDWIEADATQLQQVVVNLLLNAAEAMPDGGAVHVRTANVSSPSPDASASKDVLALIVEDTGVGIAPADRDRIFDPFFTTKEIGRGLGLAVVQGIVHAHGGKIEVDSQEGKGTTVTVLLPLADSSD